MDAIGWLTKQYGTGENVWLTADKLLRADEEGSDVEAMADIARRFKAQRLARELGCSGDEKVMLAVIEMGDRIQMRLWNEIEDCSTAGDKEQIRRRMETGMEEMFEEHDIASAKEKVKLRIVWWMGKALEKEFRETCGPSG